MIKTITVGQRGSILMNFEEYEKIGQGLYREFIETVRFVVEQAISARDDLPRPQSIQAREKSLKSLRTKLEQLPERRG
jgi:hypothetical protein